MSDNHLIKGRSSSFLLGWFVLASALAHFTYIAQFTEKTDKNVDLSFSAPLRVTVISSQPIKKSPNADITTKPPSRPVSKPRQKESEKVLTANAKHITNASIGSSTKTTSKRSKPVQNAQFDTQIPTAETQKRSQSSTQNRQRNHLQQQLKQAIKARFTYPRMARRMNWEGLVGISLYVEADGELRDIQIVRTSGHKILDENARNTIEKIGRINLASGYNTPAESTEVDVLYKLIQ